jgi:hypothetical protein
VGWTNIKELGGVEKPYYQEGIMKKSVMFLIASVVLFTGAGMARAEKKVSAHPRTTSVQANWNSFKPETLSGTLSLVGSKKKEIFLTSSDGTSYDFLVSGKTKIEIGGAPGSFEKLAGKTGSEATITFVPRPEGNFASRISVNA